MESAKARVNFFTAAPEGYAALGKVQDYVDQSGLEPRLLELVKIRASQINGCVYCLHMHTHDALKAGERPARIYLLDAWSESALYSARERAALLWTEALTHIAETRAPDTVYDEVRAQFTEKELADLSVAIAAINSWNRLFIGSRIPHPADRPETS